MTSKMSLTHLQLELPNGERIDVSLSFLNSTNAINGSLTSGSGSAEADDGYGAMLYVVVTVCVYSLGIVAFVGGHIYKRSENKRQDVLVTDYMSSVHVGKLERIRRMETVQRTSLQITRDTSKSSIARTQSYDQIPSNNNAVTESECLNDNQGDVQPTSLQITRDTSIDRTQSSDAIPSNNNAVTEHLTGNQGDGDSEVTEVDAQYLTV